MKPIVNKSDFKVTAKFKPTTDNGIVFNPLEFEWSLFYYVNPYRKFVASNKLVDGVSVLTPGVTVTDGVITIRIDSFDFQYKGTLKRDMMFAVPDPSFPDSMRQVYIRESLTEINIV